MVIPLQGTKLRHFSSSGLPRARLPSSGLQLASTRSSGVSKSWVNLLYENNDQAMASGECDDLVHLRQFDRALESSRRYERDNPDFIPKGPPLSSKRSQYMLVMFFRDRTEPSRQPKYSLTVWSYANDCHRGRLNGVIFLTTGGAPYGPLSQRVISLSYQNEHRAIDCNANR